MEISSDDRPRQGLSLLQDVRQPEGAHPQVRPLRLPSVLQGERHPARLRQDQVRKKKKL